MGEGASCPLTILSELVMKLGRVGQVACLGSITCVGSIHGGKASGSIHGGKAKATPQAERHINIYIKLNFRKTFKGLFWND